MYILSSRCLAAATAETVNGKIQDFGFGVCRDRRDDRPAVRTRRTGHAILSALRPGTAAERFRGRADRGRRIGGGQPDYDGIRVPIRNGVRQAPVSASMGRHDRDERD